VSIAVVIAAALLTLRSVGLCYELCFSDEPPSKRFSTLLVLLTYSGTAFALMVSR